MEIIRKSMMKKGQYDNILSKLDSVFKRNVVTCALFGGFEEDEGWRRECMEELNHLYSLDCADRYNRDLVILNPYILKNDIIKRDDILDETASVLSIYDSIKWDYKVMTKANILSFYISEKCANSISLFELGNALAAECDLYNPDNLNDKFKLIISINNDYPNLEALYAYLKEIIKNLDILTSIVNCHATPQSHALAIYNSYKYFQYV